MANSAASISISLVGDATDLSNSLASALLKFEGLKTGIELVFKGIQTAFEGLKTSLDSAAEIQTLASSFQVLMGSASQSKELVNSLNQLSASTHLSIDSLGNAARTLLSYGVANQSVLPDVRMLSEVAGGNADRFRRLSLAFAETAATGRLMGQEIRQFINAGFNPLQEISARTGRSIASLREDVAKGNISFAQVSDAFRTATSEGGRFFGFTEAQSQTWSGLIATLQNRVKQLFIEFGTPVIDALAPILRGAIAFTQKLQAEARQLGTIFATVSGTIINAFNSGDLGAIFGLSLQIGIKDAMNFLAGRLFTVAQITGNLISGALRAAFDPSVWTSLLKVFAGVTAILEGAAITFGAGLLQGLKSPMEYLLASCIYAARLFSDIIHGRTSKSFDEVLAAVQKTNVIGKAVDSTKNFGAQAIEKGTELTKRGGQEFIDANSTQKTIDGIMATIHDFKPINIFDSKAQEAELKALIAKNLYTPKSNTTPDRPVSKPVTSTDAEKSIKNYKAYAAKGDSLTEIGGGGGFSLSSSALVDPANETNDKLGTVNDHLSKIEQNTTPKSANEPPPVAGAVTTTSATHNTSSAVTNNSSATTQVVPPIIVPPAANPVVTAQTPTVSVAPATANVSTNPVVNVPPHPSVNVATGSPVTNVGGATVNIPPPNPIVAPTIQSPPAAVPNVSTNPVVNVPAQQPVIPEIHPPASPALVSPTTVNNHSVNVAPAPTFQSPAPNTTTILGGADNSSSVTNNLTNGAQLASAILPSPTIKVPSPTVHATHSVIVPAAPAVTPTPSVEVNPPEVNHSVTVPPAAPSVPQAISGDAITTSSVTNNSTTNAPVSPAVTPAPAIVPAAPSVSVSNAPSIPTNPAVNVPPQPPSTPIVNADHSVNVASPSVVVPPAQQVVNGAVTTNSVTNNSATTPSSTLVLPSVPTNPVVNVPAQRPAIPTPVIPPTATVIAPVSAPQVPRAPAIAQVAPLTPTPARPPSSQVVPPSPPQPETDPAVLAPISLEPQTDARVLAPIAIPAPAQQKPPLVQKEAIPLDDLSVRFQDDQRSINLPPSQFDRNARPQTLPDPAKRPKETLPSAPPRPLSIPDSSVPTNTDLLDGGVSRPPVFDSAFATGKAQNATPRQLPIPSIEAPKLPNIPAPAQAPESSLVVPNFGFGSPSPGGSQPNDGTGAIVGAIGALNPLLERIIDGLLNQKGNTINFPSGNQAFNFSTV